MKKRELEILGYTLKEENNKKLVKVEKILEYFKDEISEKNYKHVEKNIDEIREKQNENWLMILKDKRSRKEVEKLLNNELDISGNFLVVEIYLKKDLKIRL